jgi:hypothetical protein
MAFAPSNSGGGSFGGAFNEKILQNLLGGQEVFFFGDAGAGLMPISYGGALISPIPSEGAYAYGRFQYPGGVLGATQWTVFVDKDCYQNWYANATWDSSGNPSDTATHTCSGSSGGTTNPGGGTTNPGGGTPSPGTALTGITLSVSSLTVGSSANSVTIRPVPSTATLPTCTASPSNLMIADSIIAALTPNAPVWLLSSIASSLTSPTTITFTCGGQTAQLTVNPAGYATTISTDVVTHATTGAVTLRVSLTRGSAEVSAGGTVDYWVAALLPVNAMFFTTDEWFFLANNPTTNTAGWTQLTLPNPAAVAFKRGVTPAGATDVVEIPLGFSKADASPFKIQVHFGYRSGTGSFRNMGKIWDSASAN